MGVTDRRAREFQRREDDILKASFELFVEKGQDTVTIDMIAERAEVGKGTVYKHFAGKNEIFARLALNSGNRTLSEMLEIDPSLPVIVQMKKILRLIWDNAVSDIKTFAFVRHCEAYLTVDDLNPELAEEVNALFLKKKKVILFLIERAIEEEIIKDEPIENISAITTGFFQGVIDQIIHGEVEPSEELFNLFQDVLLKGLR
ncbi:MAG: TetR/AcrR family transcriptional regulator [Desulfobacterales bacterium]|nr:TetR/AcrR family transcriptional regulator [Desulfobacterales bacterium]MCP4163169.1 TetR/AcrR family transcriptional regulator [Deltaproteobacteria bacterium]